MYKVLTKNLLADVGVRSVYALPLDHGGTSILHLKFTDREISLVIKSSVDDKL